MAPKLAIFAGGGPLPAQVGAAARASGRDVVMVCFDGQTDRDGAAAYPHLWARFGAAGEILDFLRAERVQDLLFAGPVRRPSWYELRPDWRAAAFFARVGWQAFGDDGLLSAISRALAEEGFRVIGITDILADLLAPAGVLGRVAPDDGGRADIARGTEVAAALGRLDIGQAVVVQQGLVLGVEAIEGTDALIERCGGLRRAGPGGVLVKMRKPQQDIRLDLPTIGPATVVRARAAGLAGIAVEAGGSLIMDRPAVVEACDAAGLFLVGIEAAR